MTYHAARLRVPKGSAYEIKIGPGIEPCSTPQIGGKVISRHNASLGDTAAPVEGGGTVIQTRVHNRPTMMR